jgi:hypothetical protein
MMSSVNETGMSVIGKGDIQIVVGGASPGKRSLELGAASFLNGTFSIQ